MYYRWRFLIIGSIILVLGIVVIFFPFGMVRLPVLPKQNESIYLNEFVFAQLSYNVTHKQLYISDVQVYDVYADDVKLEAVMVLRGKQTYHVYFLQPHLIDEKQLFIKSAKYEGPLLLATITRMKDASVYFLDQNEYFIRADLTYICNTTLLQQKKGTCHPDSYYIEFADLL